MGEGWTEVGRGSEGSRTKGRGGKARTREGRKKEKENLAGTKV